jgi:hypothetical protein
LVLLELVALILLTSVLHKELGRISQTLLLLLGGASSDERLDVEETHGFAEADFGEDLVELVLLNQTTAESVVELLLNQTGIEELGVGMVDAHAIIDHSADGAIGTLQDSILDVERHGGTLDGGVAKVA